MSTGSSLTGMRKAVLGDRVSKATGTLTVATLPLFTVAGGLVAITSLVGRVTTTISAAGATLALVGNNTTGTDKNIAVTSADLGTATVVAGTLLVAELDGTALAIANGGQVCPHFIVETGTVDLVVATAANGAMTWAVTYVPIDVGATVVAA